jgi:16S rRNA C967 or C1407 C5-methylase (RsmB/RsmF family)
MDPTSIIETDARIAMFERLIEEREAEEKTVNTVDDATDKAIEKAITKKLVKKLTKKLTKNVGRKIGKKLIKELKASKRTDEKLKAAEEKLKELEKENAILEKGLQDAGEVIEGLVEFVKEMLADSDNQ